jgi:hypothetical protein
MKILVLLNDILISRNNVYCNNDIGCLHENNTDCEKAQY